MDHTTFGLCVDHEGRRLAGDTFSVRQQLVYGGGVVSFIEFHAPAS